MKILVSYYSRSGRTRKAAQAVAGALKADLEEIRDLRNRKGFFPWFLAGRDALRKFMTEIGETGKDPSQYDLVVLGTPVWAGNMAPALRTYIVKNRDRIRRTAFFYTSSSPAGSRVLFPDMESLCGKKPAAMVHFSRIEISKGNIQDKIRKFAETLEK